MNAAYVTHGRKYHLDPACPRMLNGEGLHDWEGNDYGGGFFAGSYRREDPDPQYAAARGKLPCLGCVPVSERVYPPLYGQTFGHEPVAEDREFFGETPDNPPVCARCSRWISAWAPVVIGQECDGRVITRDEWIRYEVSVLWPCASAVVLGLVDREEATP